MENVDKREGGTDAGRRPFFSLIVPCCDVEKFVRESLDSVIGQPFGDWECIVGVETSKDNTEAVVREIAAKEPRIRIFTAGRSGSCSASRNTGTEMARGEYVIFLDGDDTIAEGSLQRIHDKIAANPGADLYPCVIVVNNELTGAHETRENYPPGRTPAELSGPEATLLLDRLDIKPYPCPMLQLTVFRRQFLMDENLRCIYGLRHQDSEFSPRALYLAKRVVPLHEPFYIYRIRENSVQTAAKGPGHFHKDLAIRLKSLFAFNAAKSREPGFDPRVAQCWARAWTTSLLTKWFSVGAVKDIPRKQRMETLDIIFKDGFADFDALVRYASRAKRVACWWVRAFYRHPAMRGLAEAFFTKVYFPLTQRR